jgi:hypothetical protein
MKKFIFPKPNTFDAFKKLVDVEKEAGERVWVPPFGLIGDKNVYIMCNNIQHIIYCNQLLILFT